MWSGGNVEGEGVEWGMWRGGVWSGECGGGRGCGGGGCGGGGEGVEWGNEGNVEWGECEVGWNVEEEGDNR